jgi:hypothetical protein
MMVYPPYYPPYYPPPPREEWDISETMGAMFPAMMMLMFLPIMMSLLEQMSGGAAPPPPTQGTLMVDTTPVKGPVYLNGVLQGTAPVTVNLNPGTYTVSFGDVEGYVTPPPQTVNIVAGQTTTVTGTYEPVGAAEAEIINFEFVTG